MAKRQGSRAQINNAPPSAYVCQNVTTDDLFTESSYEYLYIQHGVHNTFMCEICHKICPNSIYIGNNLWNFFIVGNDYLSIECKTCLKSIVTTSE